MNSEELELSLRNEFENYLKNTIADMKQEVSEFQQQILTEFEKHKSHIDESFTEFSEKFGKDEIEDSFRETVTEHLKLARDDGSKITAAAFEEAEKLRDAEAEEAAKAAPATAQFVDIRDAINDISSKDTQSEILKTLVNHATQFTPRGAFFIVKNEHLVGWRMFGTEEHPNPEVVREVFFPVASETTLSDSVNKLGTAEGVNEGAEDGLLYLNKLDFEHAKDAYAIPLIARGRGVAVLYADNGSEGGSVNVEALETLMRVAGLTVEVLASTQIAKSQQVAEKPAFAAAPVPVPQADEEVAEEVEEQQELAEEYSEPGVEETVEEVVEEPTPEFQPAEFSSEPEAIEEAQPEVEEVVAEEPVVEQVDFQPVEEAPVDTVESVEEEIPAESEYSFEPVEESTEVVEEDQAGSFDFQPASDVAETPVDEVEETVSYDDSWVKPNEDVVEEISASEEVETPNSFDSFESNVDDSATTDFQAGMNPTFDPTPAIDSNQFESFKDVDEAETVVEDTQDSFEVVEESAEPSYEFETSNDSSFETIAEPGVEATEEVVEEVAAPQEVEVAEETLAAPPVRKRFADRNVDLPIEVTEDERRLHNDARRFARLLVSEIKLYNEQKVKEGRESSDLYERLREAIDRSREMYDKRVQPPVAAKFDYFNYEIVNTLAEGDEGKLGGSYPGAVV